MFNVPEQYRIVYHPILGSDFSYMNNGCFLIPHHRIADYLFFCQASDGEGWEHVSISIKKQVRKVRKAHKAVYGTVTHPGSVHVHREIAEELQEVERCPTWEEMCYLKSVFWGSGDVVIQFHPAEKDYVNVHPNCLHLWRPVGVELPTPDPSMVG
jgi:hypothetical protein